MNEALPVVAGLDDPVRRSQFAGLLADLAGVPISLVSVGPERTQTISRRTGPRTSGLRRVVA